MGNIKQICVELANLAKREHYFCEDSWYSCPKAEGGCANDAEGDECTCGADAHNAKVNELLAAALTEPEPEVPTDIEIASILKAYAVVEPQMGVSRILHEKHFGNVVRAVRARLGNSSAPQPLPVSEPPRPEDCDAEGRCWWLIEPYPRPVDPGGKLWSLCRYCPGANYWLPAHALPQPS